MYSNMFRLFATDDLWSGATTAVTALGTPLVALLLLIFTTTAIPFIIYKVVKRGSGKA